MKIDFLKFRKIYYVFSGILIAASIVSIFTFGLKYGIDFTGGSILEIDFKDNRPSNQDIESALAKFNLGEVVVQPTGDKGVIIKIKAITEETHQEILKQFTNAQEKQFEFIGPSVGQELRQTTIKALFLALLAIAIYIAFAFRRISRPVPSWQYGLATIISLVQNILIPLGVFAYLGKFYNVEITIPIVAALLTILAFSVHDNIVIFDRIRENLLKRGSQSFEDTVNFSLNQTLGRSINTVLTVLFVLFAILLLGGETLKYFSIALIIGITFGAYSSIFVASPLLVTWLKKPKKIDKKS
jgi:preprotein translocase subunit SecF